MSAPQMGTSPSASNSWKFYVRSNSLVMIVSKFHVADNGQRLFKRFLITTHKWLMNMKY